MPNYKVTARLEQLVSKDLLLDVSAGSEEEAEQKVRDLLAVYPDAVEEDGISRVLVKGIKHWIPRTIDVTKIRKVPDAGPKAA